MDLPCVWDAPRPYLHPVRTPAGALLTRRGAGRPPVAPRALVLDQVRQRRELLGGVRRVRHCCAPGEVERARPAARCRRRSTGCARTARRVALTETRTLTPVAARRTTRTRSTGARSSSPSCDTDVRPDAVHDLGRVRRPDAAGRARLARHPADPPRRQPARPPPRRAGRRGARSHGIAPRADGSEGECGRRAGRPPGQPALPDALVRAATAPTPTARAGRTSSTRRSSGTSRSTVAGRRSTAASSATS